MSAVSATPRELFDLVVMACRVRGVDPGTAQRIARNVVTAETSAGIGVRDVLDALVSGAEAFAASPFAWAPDRIITAEVDARRAGEKAVTVSFDEPIPWSSLAATVAEAHARGVRIEVSSASEGPAMRPTRTEQRLTIDADVFAGLRGIAAEFLVPEADVDAVV